MFDFSWRYLLGAFCHFASSVWRFVAFLSVVFSLCVSGCTSVTICTYPWWSVSVTPSVCYFTITLDSFFSSMCLIVLFSPFLSVLGFLCSPVSLFVMLSLSLYLTLPFSLHTCVFVCFFDSLFVSKSLCLPFLTLMSGLLTLLICPSICLWSINHYVNIILYVVGLLRFMHNNLCQRNFYGIEL